ncbi:hypothetical protein [Myxococcus sp. RHSTA-1-4]|uniref:hypothetical protein n=1 Tax=Myxococcus sp. RHSTA-1-4 TaxID=2874601 RepID=UPI001CBC09CC|nr:hypothetical protein [Myxococcus sp. RHSTA-1-4]MBZ4423208.1 hypothetical protein [Myxococcus sp. RHSTA-1-4]
MSNAGDTSEGLRTELENSKRNLFGGGNPPLLSALRTRFPDLSKAYVVDWIPEQGEDIFTVVIPGNMVTIVEIERTANPALPRVEVYSLEEYRKGHRTPTKERRRKLELALELLRQ